jgi:predicted transcriptional regulator
MTKEKVLSVLNKFPQEFTLDELLERLIVIEKIDEGLQDVENGKLISHKDLKKEVKKWLK